MVNRLTAVNWMRRATGQGTKGTREYHWACIDVAADDTAAGHEPGTSVLVVRRHRDTGGLSYFRCHSRPP